ncbi:OmpW/AlkL family protein [Halioxenophilus sp. WMMB6]|uniref:OmpW/AlkL family protein n=1 Tax=Halioxenophilus sp. WMMB6 TaxID=3073815 RepID=UPI00295E7F8D|nr:OmpW family outer membrane protein [Halioxenophilus sp. WMMB6]
MKMANKFLTLTTAASALALSSMAMAYEPGEISLRVGATHVAPDASSDAVKLNGTALPAKVDVDSNTQLGLTVEYFVTQNFGVELLAATPFEHTAEGKGALAGLDIADVKQLPPTLSAVYHFNPIGDFQPYVGAGLNYTIFFSEDMSSDLEAALGTGGDVSLDNSFGYALQAGFDFHLNDKWLLNASVRYIDISTTADIDLDTGDKVSVDVDIDPFVYTLSAGYRF